MTNQQRRDSIRARNAPGLCAFVTFIGRTGYCQRKAAKGGDYCTQHQRITDEEERRRAAITHRWATQEAAT